MPEGDGPRWRRQGLLRRVHGQMEGDVTTPTNSFSGVYILVQYLSPPPPSSVTENFYPLFGGFLNSLLTIKIIQFQICKCFFLLNSLRILQYQTLSENV